MATSTGAQCKTPAHTFDLKNCFSAETQCMALNFTRYIA